MDAVSLIEGFRDFFENNCIDKITDAARHNKGFFEVPFNDISKWNIDLANELLENPEEVIKAAEIAISNFDIGGLTPVVSADIEDTEIAANSMPINKGVTVWFTGLPTTQQRNVWEVRRDDIGKMIALKGIINKASQIVHICKSAKFECPTCGLIINILQTDSDFKEPSKCGCGRKGKMILLDKEITDTIKLGIIDDLMEKNNIDRSIAREKLSILSGDNLTSHSIDRMIRPGRKVIVNGYFKYRQKINSTEFDSIFQVNSIEFVEVGWDTVEISKSEEIKIKKLAKEKDIIERLSESIADIEGYKEAKKACLLLLAGAPHMHDKNGHLVSRGTIHVLLIGNPGCQPAGSKVMMADGSWKNIEDIKVGDEVLSPKQDGSYEYNKIKNTTKWYSQKNYDVVQLNRQKRKLYSCSYNHIIPFHHKVMPRRKDKRPKELRYWGYREIEAQVYSKMRMEGKQRKNVGFTSFLIPKFKGRKNCFIEPYSLGMFLGDGSFTVNKYLNKNNREYSSRQLSITTMDFEVIQEISKYYPIRNITTKEDNKAKSYYFSLNGEFAKQLNHYGLEGKKSKDKFIPEAALYSDSVYRLKLLAGLADSDGTLNKECYSITSMSNQLINGIEHLIYTLGGRCSIKERYVKYKGNKHKYYHLSFYLGSLRLPLLCKRKIKTNSEIYVSSDRIAIDVISSKSGYVYGFELESENKWYITDNYMVTHNTGKSFLAKRASAISPINYFQSAATASGKGLVASVVKDPDIDGYAVYPGVVAMATKGICCIDEIDKTHKDDYGDHNNAMNDMQITLAKANIKAKLEAETSYLATANPINRVFTPYEPYHEQIAMPKDFQDRFDIIFPMLPATNAEERNRIMDIMLERHVEESEQKVWNPEFNHEFIRKYIAYCRRTNPAPKVSRELFKTIKKRLTELMRPKEEGQVKVSYRHLESIMRFAYASARLRLCGMAEEDIDLAFTLKFSSFKDLGIVDTSGAYNWNIEEGVQEEKISDDKIIHDVLKEFLPDTNTIADLNEIVKACVGKGVDEEKVEEYIEKKSQAGDIFEPRKGFIRRL